MTPDAGPEFGVFLSLGQRAVPGSRWWSQESCGSGASGKGDNVAVSCRLRVSASIGLARLEKMRLFLLMHFLSSWVGLGSSLHAA